MTRVAFDVALGELRDRILVMGSQVQEELRLALAALDALDVELASQVQALDREVNHARFSIEEDCFTLIVTQQPAASDLRRIYAATHMSVDIERMGDQAKGIAKVVPHLREFPDLARPVELKQMGELVSVMLSDALIAYSDSDVELAKNVAARDDEVDALYATVSNQVMYQLARTESPERVSAWYEILRAARELERFGDLATNVAERSIYLVTGDMPDFSA
jgi:phosphate transport system protein